MGGSLALNDGGHRFEVVRIRGMTDFRNWRWQCQVEGLHLDGSNGRGSRCQGEKNDVWTRFNSDSGWFTVLFRCERGRMIGVSVLRWQRTGGCEDSRRSGCLCGKILVHDAIVKDGEIADAAEKQVQEAVFGE